MEPFPVVWQKIGERQGEELVTAKGQRFTYRFHKTYVVVSLGNRSVPRTSFEKIYRRREEGSLEGAPSIEGQVFILAIFEGTAGLKSGAG